MNKFLFNYLQAFFGGIFFIKFRFWPLIINLFFLIFFLVIHEILLYVDLSKRAIYITVGVISIIVLIIKLILWILNLFLQHTVELSDSSSCDEFDRPSYISHEVWQVREKLINPTPSLDAVFSDLIASGLDPEQLFKLLEYIQVFHYDGHHNFQLPKDTHRALNICGKFHSFYITPKTLNSIFPSCNNFFIVILSFLLCYGSTIFTILLKDMLLLRERWWIGIILTFSTFSILQPPHRDPYLTKFFDEWICLSRPLAIFFISAFWNLIIYLDENYTTIHIEEIYNFTINWTIFSPYLHDICRYALLLQPFLMLFYLIGHPLSVIVYIFESCNRYLFGQNGVESVIHMIIQIIRGAISVAIVWAIINSKWNGLTLAASISVAAFLTSFPVYFQKDFLHNKIITFGYPFLLSACSFIFSYCFVELVDSRWDIISWISFGWILLIDVLLPYFNSNNLYFFLHRRFPIPFPTNIFLRNFTQLVFSPLFIASALHNSNINKLLTSFLIVHSVSKAYTEPHMFFVGIFLTLVLFPYDFDLQNQSINLLLSLLISAKLEIFIPQANVLLRNRSMFGLDELIGSHHFKCMNYVTIFLLYLINIIPLVDTISKFPVLVWSFLSGSSFCTELGSKLFYTFAPFRPFYFYDSPKLEDPLMEDLFLKHVSEHVIEFPTYASVSRSLFSEFASLVRCGRLGFVNAGDMFLFQNDDLEMFVHVIVIEPNCFRIQIRGIEYASRTLCHESESTTLHHAFNEAANDFFGSNAVKDSFIKIFEIRALDIPFEMYTFSKFDMQTSFVYTTSDLTILIFLASFCLTLKNFQIDLNKICSIPHFSQEESEMYTSKLPVFEEILNILDINLDLYSDHNLNTDRNKQTLLLDFFVILCMHCLDPSGKVNINGIEDVFKGDIQYNSTLEGNDYVRSLSATFIVPFFRLGIGSVFLSNGSFLSENNIEEIVDFVKDAYNDSIFTPLSSDAFKEEFFGDHHKTIITIEKVKGVLYVLRFSIGQSKWNVCKLKQECVRAIWAYDTLDIIARANDDSERMGIQSSHSTLRNMMSQICESPVGYPAFTSRITNSFLNPFLFKVF